MNTTTIDTTEAVEAVTQLVDEVSGMDAKTLWQTFTDFLLGIAPKLVAIAVILVVGLLLIRWLRSLLGKLLVKSKLDPTLHGFLLSVTGIVLYIVLGITALAILNPSMVGGMVALLGVFGLAVSLAVKDSLANLAGGMSVLFTKPFSLGDYVKLGGNEGTVEEIRLNYTVLKTVDNKTILIPNGDVAKAEIVNYTSQTTRRLDQTYCIGYDDSFERAQQIILQILAEHPLALKEPAPVVRMSEHGDSAIKLICRVWVNTPDYWTLNYDLLEQVKRRFDQEGISIPYNQMDVHLHQVKEVE